MHDPRIGRFFAVDPLANKYPWYTPYQFSGNKVISRVELEGLEESNYIPGERLSYKLQSGDNLSTLASQYNVTVDQLRGWNPSVVGRENSLQIGEELIVSGILPKLKIAESDNEPGNAADMQYGDFSKAENCELVTSQIFMEMNKGQLFNMMKDLMAEYTDDPKILKNNIAMCRKFMCNEGGIYESDILNSAAANHPSTQRFIKHIQKQIKIMASKVDVMDSDFGITLVGHPRFNEVGFLGFGYGDEDNGLKIAVNDVWAYEVSITNIEHQGDLFKANVELILYDHFGLDKPDMEKIFKYVSPGFNAWWVLQHHHGWKPFITKMTINFEAYGAKK